MLHTAFGLLILSAAPSVVAHPLEPLTYAEIDHARQVVQAAALCRGACYYPFVSLREPSKLPVLTRAHTPREAQVTLLDRDMDTVYDIVVDLDAGALTRVQRVPGAQPLIMIEELNQLPAIVKRDPRWQAAMRRRGISDMDAVHVDAWAQGYDDDEHPVDGARMLRALSFYRGNAINAYARPIEGVVALVNMTEGRVVRLMDTGVIPIAPQASDFFDTAYLGAPRGGVQPLQVAQPNGPSFSLDGHHIRWQNWSLRFAMQPREGLVIYDVGYADAGKLRSILWRASLSEMVVPYGDPDPAWSWRSAFDVGEYGIGRLASPLEAGVEVPEHATLVDAVFSDDFGQPYTAPRVVAIYERDGGLAWKHYDINTGRNAARRARELVVSFITTVGNYDYALAWVFAQDGSLRMETELTGIMLAKGIEPDGEPPLHAHVVAKGVAAPHHQHYFSFRLDMDVDGLANSLMEMNTRTLDAGDDNPRDNGFVMQETMLATESQAQRDLNMPSSRKWVVVNTAHINELGSSTGYALIPGDNSVPYARPQSFARKRAGFIEHHLWATQFHADELYAAGDYPNQSLGGDGLPRYVADNESLQQHDLVLWYTLGVTHIPRPEEWPVMPTAKVGFTLLPVGFFTRNPALDLPCP